MEQDILETAQPFLKECGTHDFGLMEYGCTCPEGDFRPVMLRLVEEVQRLRDKMKETER